MAPGLTFDLMDQLVFYGSYHQKKGNQFIHFIFVPLIMWSAGVFLAYAGPLTSTVDLPSHLDFLPVALAQSFVLNWTLLFFVVYSLYYMTLEPFAGTLWLLLMGLPSYVTANAFQQHVPYAWAWAIGTFFLGWYMQIHIGHMMIENKRPALMDSLFQSFALAGLFAWLEGLFALGYRPKLRAELERRVHEACASDAHGKQPLLRQDLLTDKGT